MAGTMRGLHTEYILKGLYLGLLLFVALQATNWPTVGMITLVTFGGLALLVAVAAFQKLREGYQVQGRFLAFLLFLLLESPEFVYAGILLGITGAVFLLRHEAANDWLLGVTAGGGAGLGIVFWLLRYVRHRWVRLGLSLLLAVVLVTGALLWFGQFGELGQQLGLQSPVHTPAIFSTQLLLGIPLFYLLTFAGKEEESEIEIGAICAALGLGIGMLTIQNPTVKSALYLIPVVLYFWYTTRVLPNLRVFKHAVRGFSYHQIGRYRQSILSFRRALQFDPENALAREGLWSVHRTLDLSQLANDPETLAVIDLDMCMDRVGSLLLKPAPSAEKLQEAQRLLDFVLNQKPGRRAVILYWRAVAHTHAGLYDQAAEELEEILDPSRLPPDDVHRRQVLLQAWQLALRSHPELAQRVGVPQLALPGRRMEAIGAVERYLADNTEDAEVWALKRILYQDLTESAYHEVAGPNGTATDFDYGYVQQLGLALINDPARWRRGGEYLRMAARGLPALGPSLYSMIAQAHQREGDGEGAWQSYEQAKRTGLAVGPRNLGDADRQAYFTAVKLMADAALAHDQIDLAIENFHLYTESPRSGVETLRTLADLYERKGDPLPALRVTEQALLYNAKDKDFLERKDRYYYSVLPDDLRARLDTIKGGFDIAYCLRKAKSLLDMKNWDLDSLDWAQHLAELVRVVQPENLTAKVQVTRARLRRGEKEEALALLEEVRSVKPENIANGEDEDAWYLACKLLGDIYLNDLGKPDLAVECFKAFRKSSKSGADTLYKLGQAYEQLGDRERAVKFYKHVVSYDSHPLAPDANEALHRLQAR
jgi:tetratricopeptide (TPR) repeat protein